jgi:hypothetical protein
MGGDEAASCIFVVGSVGQRRLLLLHQYKLLSLTGYSPSDHCYHCYLIDLTLLLLVPLGHNGWVTLAPC